MEQAELSHMYLVGYTWHNAPLNFYYDAWQEIALVAVSLPHFHIRAEYGGCSRQSRQQRSAREQSDRMKLSEPRIEQNMPARNQGQ